MNEIIYEVRVGAILEQAWRQWFPDIRLEIERPLGGTARTLIVVPGSDVSLLHGVLAQIGSLNLCLLSVVRRGGEQ